MRTRGNPYASGFGREREDRSRDQGDDRLGQWTASRVRCASWRPLTQATPSACRMSSSCRLSLAGLRTACHAFKTSMFCVMHQNSWCELPWQYSQAVSVAYWLLSKYACGRVVVMAIPFRRNRLAIGWRCFDFMSKRQEARTNKLTTRGQNRIRARRPGMPAAAGLRMWRKYRRGLIYALPEQRSGESGEGKKWLDSGVSPRQISADAKRAF